MKKKILAFSFVLLMKRKCVFTIIVVSAVILGITATTAYADDPSADATYWQGPVNSATDWFSGSNWNKGTPDSSDDACIDNGGIAQITSGTAVAGSLHLAPGTTVYPSPGWQTKEGHLVQSDGSLTISNGIYLGNVASYTLTGGNLSSQELEIGSYYGNALFQQSGGSNSTGNLTVDWKNTYKFESGTLTVTGEENIDHAGIFEQTGGNHVTNYIVLGSHSSGGHYVLSGGTLDAFDLYGTNSSTVEHSGGSSVMIAMWGVGSYNLSQTNANNPSSLTTDWTNVLAGQTFTQSGGVHNTRGSQGIYGGEYTLVGGTNTVGAELYIVGDGIYRMTGGSLTASRITVGDDEYGNGTLEVASGCTVSAVENSGSNWSKIIRTSMNSSVDLSQGGKVLVGNVNTGLTGAITIGIDGVLEGNGTIIGSIANQGIVKSSWVTGGYWSPVYSPGTLTITGDYEQESNGILALFMAGSDADSFSRMSIGGQAYLDGELSLSLIDGFIPNIGDTFEILNASSCYGNFSSFNVVGLPDDMFFDIEYGSNNVVLEVVPEPTTLVLLGLGGLFLRAKNLNQ